jgi:hypothetical protein
MIKALEIISVVCGQIFVSIPPHAFRLDSVTDRRSPITDGVYQTERPFCIYTIEQGMPHQKTETDE